MDKTKELIAIWRSFFSETFTNETDVRLRFDTKMRTLEAFGISKEQALYTYKVVEDERLAQKQDKRLEEMRGHYQELLRLDADRDNDFADLIEIDLLSILTDWNADWPRALKEPEEIFNAFVATLKKG
jgi:hypothetical protein